MSVVAIKKYSRKIVVACDSQTTWGDSKYPVNTAKAQKINEMIVGAVGAVEEISLFNLFCSNHKPSSSTVLGVTQFLVEFVKFAKEYNSSFVLNSHYFIVFESSVFRCIGLEVSTINDFDAIGSGMWLAKGAFELNATPMKAVEVAKKYDLYCSGETTVIEYNLK